MNMDESMLRKKWKYLRDQFSVKCSKIKTPRSGDAAGTNNQSKWPYFRSMLFLKDIVKPRASSSNLKPKSSTVIEIREDTPNDDASAFGEEDTENIDLNLAERETSNENLMETKSVN